jgi:hypothetical protein
MIINVKLKQRLDRLEQAISIEHVPVTIQLMRLALPEVCDDDLHILKLVFRRGAPISAETVQETAAVERFSVELASAAQKMGVQRHRSRRRRTEGDPAAGRK